MDFFASILSQGIYCNLPILIR